MSEKFSRRTKKSLKQTKENQRKYKLWVCLSLHELVGETAFKFCNRHTDNYLRNLFVLKFVINGIILPLRKVINVCEKVSFSAISAQIKRQLDHLQITMGK